LTKGDNLIEILGTIGREHMNTLEVIRLSDRVWQFHEKNEFSPVDAEGG
jgi:hypothetical protein